MGLADIKGEKCFDVFADVMGPLMNIAADKEAMEFFKVHEKPEDVDQNVFNAQIMKEHLPVLMKGHKDDFIDILAALNGQTRKQYVKDLTVPVLFKNVMDLFTDPTFRSFLS